MIAPGTCKECGTFTKERFPIIERDTDCRPTHCKDCATKHNLKHTVTTK